MININKFGIKNGDVQSKHSRPIEQILKLLVFKTVTLF